MLRKEGTARGQLDPARVVRFQEHDGGAKKLKCGGFKRRPFSTWQTQAPQRRATSAPGLRHVRTMLDDPPVRHLRPHNRVRDDGARSRAGRAAGAQTGAGGRAHRPIDRGHCLARRPSAVLAAAVRERVDGPSPPVDAADADVQSRFMDAATPRGSGRGYSQTRRGGGAGEHARS